MEYTIRTARVRQVKSHKACRKTKHPTGSNMWRLCNIALSAARIQELKKARQGQPTFKGAKMLLSKNLHPRLSEVAAVLNLLKFDDTKESATISGVHVDKVPLEELKNALLEQPMFKGSKMQELKNLSATPLKDSAVYVDTKSIKQLGLTRQRKLVRQKCCAGLPSSVEWCKNYTKLRPSTIDAAMIVGNDIHLYSDGRCTSAEFFNDGEIVCDSEKKYLSVGTQTLMAEAGDSVLIEPLRALVECVVSVDYNVDVLKLLAICQVFISLWRTNHSNIETIPLTVMVCGFLRDYSAVIYVIGSEKKEVTEQNQPVVIGCGKNSFHNYFDFFLQEKFKHYDRLELLEAGVTSACMYTESCGGYIDHLKISANSKCQPHINKNHVLRLICKHHNRLLLENIRLCTSWRIVYSLETEKWVKNIIEEKVGDIYYVQIIGLELDKNLTVRLVEFENPVSLSNVPKFESNKVEFDLPTKDMFEILADCFDPVISLHTRKRKANTRKPHVMSGVTRGRTPSIHVDEFMAREIDRQASVPRIGGEVAAAQARNVPRENDTCTSYHIDRSSHLKEDLDDDLNTFFDVKELEHDDKLPFSQVEDNLQQLLGGVVEGVEGSLQSIVEETENSATNSVVDKNNVLIEYSSRIPEPLSHEASISLEGKFVIPKSEDAGKQSTPENYSGYPPFYKSPSNLYQRGATPTPHPLKVKAESVQNHLEQRPPGFQTKEFETSGSSNTPHAYNYVTGSSVESVKVNEQHQSDFPSTFNTSSVTFLTHTQGAKYSPSSGMVRPQPPLPSTCPPLSAVKSSTSHCQGYYLISYSPPQLEPSMMNTRPNVSQCGNTAAPQQQQQDEEMTR